MVRGFVGALKYIVLPEFAHIMDAPWVRSFYYAADKLNATVPKLPPTLWNPLSVLDFLAKMGSPEQLDLPDLTHKTLLLFYLATSCRGQLAANLCLKEHFMRRTDSFLEFALPTPMKTFYKDPAASAQSVRQFVYIHYYELDPRICLFTHMCAYLDRTQVLVANRSDSFFLLTVPPFTAASQSTIMRWVKSLMHRAWVDVDLYRVHSTRGASSSLQAAMGEPIHLIMKRAGWAVSSTFYNHYARSLHVAEQSANPAMVDLSFFATNERATHVVASQPTKPPVKL